MIKNKSLFKNLLCVFTIIFLTAMFIGIRWIQLYGLTKPDTGVCYEFRIFDSCYIIFNICFTAFSFLFFKYIYKPKFKNFNSMKQSKILGVLSFLISILVSINSFFILSEANSKGPISGTFSTMFFLTGIFLAVSFIVFAIYIIFNLDFLKVSLSLIFYSVFLWSIVRFFSFVLTNSFLHYATVEYKLSVIGLIFIFLFFYYFGRLALNYNGLSASCGLLTFGFSAVFVVFANVVPKLILNYMDIVLSSSRVNNSFFARNIDLFYFYNFNLVDFVIALFIFLFLIIFMFSDKNSESAKN